LYCPQDAIPKYLSVSAMKWIQRQFKPLDPH
jgi:hypothetical protein